MPPTQLQPPSHAWDPSQFAAHCSCGTVAEVSALNEQLAPATQLLRQPVPLGQLHGSPGNPDVHPSEDANNNHNHSNHCIGA